MATHAQPGLLDTAGTARAEVSASSKRADAERRRCRLAAAVKRHGQLVWRSLRRFGVPERDADDAAQQVFLTFTGRMDEVIAGNEAAYLVAIAVRIAANFRRRYERSPLDLTGDVDVAPAIHNPEGLLNEKQLRAELDRGLATLSLEQRAVFVLHELEGFSLPEIAAALDIPLGTATSRLRRARIHFEAWVKSRNPAGGESP